jgi:hypothetical protein
VRAFFHSRCGFNRDDDQFELEAANMELEREVLEMMAEFEPWRRLQDGLRTGNRYDAVDPAYVDELILDCQASKQILGKNTPLYRARIEPADWEGERSPIPIDKMGAPPPAKAKAGRLNPEGIPYFYGALSVETAIAEMRAWKGARITVAEYRNAHALEIVDLTVNVNQHARSPKVKWLSSMLGVPVHRDDPLGYLATQFIAERIKRLGVSGVLYDSRASDSAGTNAAFFSMDAWKPVEVRSHEMLNVEYKAIDGTTPPEVI